MGPDLSRQSQAEVDRRTGLHELSYRNGFRQHASGPDGEARRAPTAMGAAATPCGRRRPPPARRHIRRSRSGPRAAASPRPVAELRQPRALLRSSQPGERGVHAVRQPRRPAGGGPSAAGCHPTEVAQVEKSMMKTGPMLWAAALYNNGGYPIKRPTFGEATVPMGAPARAHPAAADRRGDGEERRAGLARPAAALRARSAGQRPARVRARAAAPAGDRHPSLDELPGRPANRLSQRGFGTLNRTDPVWLNLQKTRLFDPLLSLLGTNEHPGEFRSSGCTGLPRDLRQRPLAGAFRARTRSTATAGSRPRPTRRSRRTSRATPSSTSSRTRSRRASASSVTSTPAPR